MTIQKWGIFLLVILLLVTASLPSAFADSLDTNHESDGDFRGIWVATVLNLDYPQTGTTSEAALERQAIEILDQAQTMGMNAVILQVRPASDSLYPSKIFPWSTYLTGAQGVAPEKGFDPLAFWVQEAHARGLELHAWINPYRITRKVASDPAYNYASLADNHPALEHPEWVVEHSDGNLYFNPGIPEVRDLITAGIMEIVENYGVDGIHLDDYFYPESNFEDSDTYQKYGDGFNSIGDWRRNNVDLLIQNLDESIHFAKPDVSFGISPFGIWANRKDNSYGSETYGLQSYYSHYADTRKWVEKGWIDYIAPQIYWQIGYAAADYQILLDWWNDVVDGTDVKLYVGHAAYRSQNTDENDVWYGTDEIERQLAANAASAHTDGSIFFRYGTIKANAPLLGFLSTHYAIKDGETIQDQFMVSRPTADVKTTADHYFIGGASDSRYPLYMNGAEITDRTANGYFGVYVPLEYGINQFIFMQNGNAAVREITRSAVSKAQSMKIPAIVDGSTAPSSLWMGQPGETLTLSCKAPAGASVTATINGKTVTLATESTAGGLYPATFSGTYTLPETGGTPRMINLGAPVYRMTYQGTTDTERASYDVNLIMPGTKRVATVANEFTDSYATPTTSNGRHFILTQGMQAYVTGVRGAFTRLNSGFWVKTEELTFADGVSIDSRLKSVSYERGTDADVLTFESDKLPLAAAAFDGDKVTVTLWNTTGAMAAKGDALADSVSYTKGEDYLMYSIALEDPTALGGYYLENTGSGIQLVLRHKFVASKGDAPLAGATILIDPGHGGNDTGAIGLLGSFYAEKHMNLDLALKLKTRLEGYGARVMMTRTQDTYMSLQDRLYDSYQVMPDLFISVHADSLDETSDLTNVQGFSVFYKDPLAASMAESIRTHVIGGLERRDRGARTANFYVVRGTWTPSVLMESGFMPNPAEFDWMSSSNGQILLSNAWADAILEFFSSDSNLQ